MAKKIFTCSCCGEDVTAPYFATVDGVKGVYGYTCILKFVPSTKRQKSVKYQPAEIKLVEFEDGQKEFKINYNGVKVGVRAVAKIDGDTVAWVATGQQSILLEHQAVSDTFLKTVKFRFRTGGYPRTILEELEHNK